jgi:hypothetical protein
MAKTTAALTALAGAVRPLSHPKALESAFRSYFAYMAAHPDEVKKPVLYFVDYGLPSTEPRGYIFDMRNLSIIEGPFAVAHGRGSSRSQYGIPDRFSNALGSAATSLGLYLAESTYQFTGHTAATLTADRAPPKGRLRKFQRPRAPERCRCPRCAVRDGDQSGRSEGCPAMEQDRARRVLPELADGGMVFLFAPDQSG